MEEAPVNACPAGFRPWVHFGFRFSFLHFWVYSAFMLEKLLPACGDRLSSLVSWPLVCPLLIIPPPQAHFLSKIHLHVTAPHESPAIMSVITLPRAFSPTFKEQDGWLLAGLLVAPKLPLVCIWFLSRGKVTRYHSVP